MSSIVNGIKRNSERVIQGLRTKKGEFKYKLTDGFVRGGMVYSIYFTEDKREVYMTGLFTTTNSKIILKQGKKSIINTYHDLNNTIKQTYPQTQIKNPTDDEYKVGFVTRYFARFANDETKPYFEISEDDYGRPNSLFIYDETIWYITGDKENIRRRNQNIIDSLPKGISRNLFALQLWRPLPDSSDALEKKLERLRK